MHFPIIAYAFERVDKDEWIKVLPVDDPVLSYNTDYCGNIYSPEERKKVLKSAEFKYIFSGLGDIDVKKETIKLYDSDKIRATLLLYYKKELDKLIKMAESETTLDRMPVWELFYKFRRLGHNYCDSDILFYNVENDYCQESMPFIEDLSFYAGKTLYIQNIFDAHC